MSPSARAARLAARGSLCVAALAFYADPTLAEVQGTAVVAAKASDTRAEVNVQQRRALSAYEHIRASLAADDIQGIGAHAAELHAAAAMVGSNGVEHWPAIAAAAKMLKDLSKEDATKVRVAFGELSKRLIAAIAHDRKLTSGLHVFECPMAPGHKKWFQPSATIDNPYMGKRMPRCGKESDWKS